LKIEGEKTLLTIIIALFSIPFVFAAPVYSTVRMALNRVVGLISSFMHIPLLENNLYVQIGFIKFGIFLIIFSFGFFGLLKAKIERKPAGITSFVVAFIGSALMPNKWVLFNGGLFIGIVSSAFLFLILYLGFYFSIVSLKPSSGNSAGLKIAKGFGIFLIAMLMLQFFNMYIGFFNGGSTGLSISGGSTTSTTTSASSNTKISTPPSNSKSNPGEVKKIDMSIINRHIDT